MSLAWASFILEHEARLRGVLPKTSAISLVRHLSRALDSSVEMDRGRSVEMTWVLQRVRLA